jgi:hypothetical protein
LAKSVNVRDARMLAEARDAIAMLAERGGAGATGRELLGESFLSGRWGRNFIRRLSGRGLVTVEEPPPNGLFGRRAHVFVATASLAPLVGDDEQIALLVWPGTSYLESRSATDDEATATVEEEEEAPPGRPEGEDDVAALLENVPSEALLETAIKLCAMTLQNVVYMRERVDALAKEIADLKKAWE